MVPTGRFVIIPYLLRFTLLNRYFSVLAIAGIVVLVFWPFYQLSFELWLLIYSSVMAIFY